MILSERWLRLLGIAALSAAPLLAACGTSTPINTDAASKATAAMNRVQNYLEGDAETPETSDEYWDEICSENTDGSETCSFDDGFGTSCSVTFNTEGTVIEDGCAGAWGSYNCVLSENLLNCDLNFEGEEPCSESWDTESFEIVESTCDFFELPADENPEDVSGGDWDDNDENTDETNDHDWGDWDDEDSDNDNDWGDCDEPGEDSDDDQGWGDEDLDTGDWDENDEGPGSSCDCDCCGEPTDDPDADNGWGDWDDHNGDDDDSHCGGGHHGGHGGHGGHGDHGCENPGHHGGDEDADADNGWGDWDHNGDDEGSECSHGDDEDADADHGWGDWDHNGDDEDSECSHGDDEDSGDHDWGDEPGDDQEPSESGEECFDNEEGIKECHVRYGPWSCVSLFADGEHPTYESCGLDDGSESFTCVRESGDEEVNCSYTHGGQSCEETFTPWELIESTCDEGFWGQPEDVPMP